MNISVGNIHEKLMKTGPLKHRIIGVFGCDERPADAVTVGSVIKNGTPCLAKALFKMSSQPNVPPIYVSRDAAQETCPGVLMWFGFVEFPPMIEQMFTSDSPDTDSLCIKHNTELCTATFRDMGQFTPAGKYIVLRPIDGTDDGPGRLKSVLCFGDAQQIRNLGALVHYGAPKAFTPIMAPWGSGCSTFAGFPAGMASNAPKNTAFLSPVIPEANSWLPADTFALGIPIEIAARMADGYPSSFLVRQPSMAYPDTQEEI